MNKILSIVFSALLLLLGGCGGDEAPQAPTGEQTAEKDDNSGTKAIYVASNVSDLAALTTEAKALGANAVVIDVKDEFGKLTCKLDVEGAETVETPIADMKTVVKTLKDSGFYTIARIVAFKDHMKDAFSIKGSDGNVWTDADGASWLNPYNAKAKKYLANITAKTAALGFDEIQYDYLRFSASLKDDIDLGNESKEVSRAAVITAFLETQAEALHKTETKLSVIIKKDVIEGIGAGSAADNVKTFGQDYVKIAEIADFVCPKIYPSKFAKDAMGIANPGAKPYDTVKKALELSSSALKDNSKVKAVVRPYLQAFSATGVDGKQEYTKKEVDEEIKAVKDSGLKEWGLYSSSGSYHLD